MGFVNRFFNSLYALITFPGIIVHEISHKFFCDIFKIPVYNVTYLNLFSDTSGSVTYKKIYSLLPTFFINIAPLIINTVGAIISIFIYSKWDTSFGLVFYWLGVSLALHAIPSNPDLNNITIILNRRKRKPRIINGIVRILEFISPLRNLGFDLFYAYLIIKIVPIMFDRILS